jgi:dipeptidase E
MLFFFIFALNIYEEIMRLLLISNSTNAGEKYLEYPKINIKDFLGGEYTEVLFIPYAGVTFSFDDYEQKVQERFSEIGIQVKSIHKFSNAIEAVEKAQVIVVGGGNTFRLLKLMQDNNILDTIRKKVLAGTPFIGWSAGSNVACPTIRTTNDMPVIQPAGFDALNLVPFQINPHYLDANPDGHAGETREQRLQEFLELNPEITVIGLREGTMLNIENNSMKLIGPRSARIFKKGAEAKELSPNDDFSYLLKK